MSRYLDSSHCPVLWTKEKGLCFDVKQVKIREHWYIDPHIFHGMAAWVIKESRPEHFLVYFDAFEKEFVFPEKFKQNKKERKERELMIRAEKKIARDRLYCTVSTPSTNSVMDSGERADTPPDTLIVPFTVRTVGTV